MPSLWTRIFDLLAPRHCVMCGGRLAIGEQIICTRCNLHLPRTGFGRSAYDNEMARMFWGRMAVERCAALFYYRAGAEASRIIYELKYRRRAEIGLQMGALTARELMGGGFFEGIDLIVPVPLARVRVRERGYNQSSLIAQGIGRVTGIGVADDVVERTNFTESQTQKHRWQRMENVEGAFTLRRPEALTGRHVLLVDDVVTTGSTICSLATELNKAGNVKFSVLSLGFVTMQL